ncbi:EF-hand domain-containing protein [Flavobacterium frigoris]|uniref:EF hand n=1 Tax=Flavobacterium frigoris TaxID=229204 RepID=A0A1H9NUY2_FLAFI|nr:EF-hand domain-containing protein [Flavobacterium frigoris]SER39409.1 EF hand [Flavobacterium frigoris]
MKNKMISKIVYSILMLLVGTVFTYAQPPRGQEGKNRPTAEVLIKEMDINKDGKLSKGEVKGPLQDDFSKVDANKDGFLTLEELKKAPKPERKK